ncbi:MAG: DUF4388 domain-containing protein [Chloroflexi bacterium]|nr:DUF4388 domain-containing protein [Chloroflexota bacterium]
MGLEGYLEDLGIGDILQIVSLSKKSGTLSLNKLRESGSITFVDGQVVRATSSSSPETLGQLLNKAKLVTEEQIAEALARQQQLKMHQPLGRILSETCQIKPEVIEAVVREHVEKVVFSFLSWTSGAFVFQLGEPQVFGSTALNPFDFMLEKGISSQRLVFKAQTLSPREGDDGVADDAAVEREIARLESRLDNQGLSLLRGMLAELEYASIGGGIILLILRYASEIMNRAIVFDVRGRQLVGLGQFGLSGLSMAADEIVRKMRLNIEPGSLFAKVMQQKTAIRSPLSETSAERALAEILGGPSKEVFLGPLVSDGKVVAILYGDNYPDNKPIKSANSFEIFLSQAGLAMEQALQV